MACFSREPQGYVVYIDETGSFELRVGRTDAIASVVVPRRAVPRVRAFVQSIESSADESERVKGEVKGSHLRPDRFPGIVRFARRRRIRFSPFVGRQAVASAKEKGLMPEARKLRSLTAGTPREGEGRAVAATFENLGAHDRYYCTFAYRLIKEGLVRDLVRAGRWPIEVAYDPRLKGTNELVLRFAINSAFTELHFAHVASPIDALLGDASMPWTIRPAGDDDREGVALADWLVYPMGVVHREEVDPVRRATYAAICDRYDKARLAVYPIIGPDDAPVRQS